MSRWNASDLDAVEGGSGRVLSNKLHLFAQPSLCCKVAKQKYWEVKVATTFVTRTCGYIESTGRPRKKLVSELLNSIKGALLCWMFKFSNAAL